MRSPFREEHLVVFRLFLETQTENMVVFSQLFCTQSACSVVFAEGPVSEERTSYTVCLTSTGCDF